MGLLVLLFLVKVFQWFPPLGTVYIWDDPLTNLKTLAWPVLVVAYFNNAAITRMTRAQMLEVLRQDYMRTARRGRSGLIESLVVYRHGLRNAVLPVGDAVRACRRARWWVARWSSRRSSASPEWAAS